MAQSSITAKQCAQCAAPFAEDQRYCLQCGEPGKHLGGPPLVAVSAPERPAPTASSLAPPGFPTAPPRARNNSLALIAGVGVLLLAMGVGVLIGRAGAGSVKAPPAQVISLGSAGSAAGVTSTPTTAAPTTSVPSTPTKKSAKAKEPSGTGSSIDKPAPPSAAQNLRGGSGQSYEQKSKNLPNVVSTG